MPSLIYKSSQMPVLSDRRRLVIAVFPAIVFVAFLLAPGSIAVKTHAALHGLCAQRPSHSLHLGGTVLPMDARMTGIYIGAAIAVGWLMCAGRLRSVRTPSPPVVVTLAGFVIALAIDGFNALLADLHVVHPYEPSNQLRLVTGILAGTTLGIVLVHLVAASIWAQPERHKAIVTTPAELLVPISVSAAVGVIALSGLPILYAPFAVGLLLATVGVFSLLIMVAVVLIADRGWSFRTSADLAPLALTGFLGAIFVTAGLSGLRFAGEQFWGLPQLT